MSTLEKLNSLKALILAADSASVPVNVVQITRDLLGVVEGLTDVLAALGAFDKPTPAADAAQAEGGGQVDQVNG
jgi:hypothetical protein